MALEELVCGALPLLESGSFMMRSYFMFRIPRLEVMIQILEVPFFAKPCLGAL